MAYKFQVGTANLGGALNVDADIKAVGSDAIVSGTIGRFTHLSCSANSIVIGGTTLSEAELGVLDGLADHDFSQTQDKILFFHY